ncbi:MAG: beta-N-acetylhexosaminidase [Candidatus Eremiobacteraeota bacterium]|nr:beta-N-acetylhexosaminidase [Candidatus Eremiobacteraeota bacterium]
MKIIALGCAVGVPMLGAAPARAMEDLQVLPHPNAVSMTTCAKPFRMDRSLRVGAGFDPAALAELNERWRALGLPPVVLGRSPDITVTHDAKLASQAYFLNLAGSAIRIKAGDADGAFYAAMTLAQLPTHSESGWALPCGTISDAPALKWRILSDDVSRGPLPTMRYFEERIRTIAAFKMNGYSPYMEHVFLSPTDPLPAPLDGITPAQLHALALYAKRFHVAFVPEQQSFAHMHNTLKVERYADLAELPHGFLLSPNVVGSNEYLARLVKQELAAVPHPPFFHIGSDETSTLGLGRTADYVVARGKSQAYADHIVAMAKLIAPSGARPMLWDDGIENDPGIMKLIPRNSVIVNWHYGAQKTFQPQIDLIAKGGFDQMVSPGANNWNEIFPDLAVALRNENLFITQGKVSHVLGLFQTVWHDDGESLFEATWYPVLYSAASSWEAGAVEPTRFQTDFPHAFFGVDDARYGSDVAVLSDALTKLEAPGKGYDSTDYLMWADPFVASIAARMASVDLHAVRLESERVQEHLLAARPPLHRNAAAVMFLAARKYDLIARKFQAAQEARDYYADAVAHAGQPHSPTIRDLYWCKYWFWELRDDYEELAPHYATAWRYEDRESHLASNLERYHIAAQQNIARADAINRAIYEQYVPNKTLPAFETLVTP